MAVTAKHNLTSCGRPLRTSGTHKEFDETVTLITWGVIIANLLMILYEKCCLSRSELLDKLHAETRLLYENNVF